MKHLCASEVEALRAIQAAEAMTVEVQALNALIANGAVHAIQTVSGNLLVCKDSLFSTWEKPS